MLLPLATGKSKANPVSTGLVYCGMTISPVFLLLFVLCFVLRGFWWNPELRVMRGALLIGLGVWLLVSPSQYYPFTLIFGVWLVMRGALRLAYSFERC